MKLLVITLFILILLILMFNTTNISLATSGATGMLVIDTSGSLKKADPEGLRHVAFELFLYVMGLQSSRYSCGIVHFSSEARLVQPLTVIDIEAFELLKEQLEKPGSEGATEIGLGLEAAYEELIQSNQARRYVILISDGELYGSVSRRATDRHKAAYDELMNEILPRYATSNIPIFTICLRIGEPEGQPGLPTGEQLLNEIASLAGGKAYRAKVVGDLSEIFKDIRYLLLKPAAVSVTDESGAFWKGQYDDVVYVISPQELMIVGPDGQNYSEHDADPESIFNNIGGHQVALLRNTPPGEYWVKDLRGQPISGVEVHNISDLFLTWQSTISKQYSQHEVIPIKAKLNYAVSIPEGTTCVAKIWRPGEKQPRIVKLSPDADGSYSDVFSDTELGGIYQLHLEFISPELYLRRTLWTEFEVNAKPWFSHKIENTNPNHYKFIKKDTARIVVMATENIPKLSGLLDIKTQILNPKGKLRQITLTEYGENEYVRITNPLKKKGEYEIIIQVSGRCILSPSDIIVQKSTQDAIFPPTRPFLVQIRDRIKVEESFTQWLIKWITWMLIMATVIFIITSVLWHVLPTPEGPIELLKPYPIQIQLLEDRAQPGIWHRLFPRRRTIIGTAPDSDISLRSNPIEFTDSKADQEAKQECLRTLGDISHWDPKEYAGVSAELYCDLLGRLRLRSLRPREKSHVYVNGRPVGKKGMLLEDRNFAVMPEVRIGKFKFRI